MGALGFNRTRCKANWVEIAKLAVKFSPRRHDYDELKESPSKTLSILYPLVGRLLEDGSTIECNDEGAEFVRAHVTNYDLGEFLWHPKLEDLQQLLPFEPYPDAIDPAMPMSAVQVNRFRCGGTVVGFFNLYRCLNRGKLKYRLSHFVSNVFFFNFQRRRTAVDELNMRSIFEEHDVVCAEVRGFQHDGSLHLQARSQKYGKLERGQLLIVSPYLVKKRKQHFHHLDQYQIDLILGCNGFNWIGEHVDVKDDTIEDPSTKSSTSMVLEEEEKYTSPEVRLNVCRIANAIRVLSNLGFMITVEVLLETVGLSESLNHVHEMLGAEFYVMVAEKEAERRRSQLTKKR
ncbi:PREDICTED: exosome complex component RRP4 homolog [Ipomoea nil]|uniref:exosome complex component RRP4 homolog n=1 Tax=Ipomoea nil TaxID=35883 RepID=UPI0009017B62|nr:PREDICTED: exosome complex component RRP4 homolog [Ipomoea nil]